ncbi:MAG: hypothetical protein PVG35_17025 [Desulfobacterales bacterium]|jgi:hypothetical protein
MKWKVWITAAALAAAVLWGCYESTGVAFHEPGVYKGKQDPLLGKLRQTEVQQQLVERFKMVQTDR